jgi:hypothetical protein
MHAVFPLTRKVASYVGAPFAGGTAAWLGAGHQVAVLGAAVASVALVSKSVSKCIEAFCKTRAAKIKAQGEADAARTLATMEADSAKAKAEKTRALDDAWVGLLRAASDSAKPQTRQMLDYYLLRDLQEGRELSDETIRQLLTAFYGSLDHHRPPDSGPEDGRRPEQGNRPEDGPTGVVLSLRPDE